VSTIYVEVTPGTVVEICRGISPQRALPVLATYMGHLKYQYTAAYLKVKDAGDIAGLISFTKSKSAAK